MLFEKIKLEDDEKILVLVRRHWFVFLLKILGVILTAIIPLVIVGVLTNLSVTAPLIGETLAQFDSQIKFLIALWLLFNWITLAFLWTDQYLDLWVITNKRIISIDQKRIFFRNIGSFRLEHLQDLNIEIPGFLATIFNYGNVEAQTASGSEDEFRVKSLPDPRGLKAIISEAADTLMKTRYRMPNDSL